MQSHQPFFLKPGLSLMLICLPFILMAQSTRVFHMHIDDNIDPRMNRYVKLALEEAENQESDIILIEMDTYGGAVNDADDIRTALLDTETPTYVFINKDAASAGALISFACDSIYMAPGASIGAATVVVQTGEAAPDKYQSYMRSIMRSTAEAKGRNPEIAEAMVDESIYIEGISDSGKVLTLSTSEAIKYEIATAEVISVTDALEHAGIYDYEITEFELSALEKIIALVLNPAVSGILILIILGGIYFELQTPGVGFPIAAAVIALTIYLIPHYLHGLAAYWEIILFFIGLVLIGLEIFVIPGFGIAGISGLILTLGSLTLIMLGNDFFDFSGVPTDQIYSAMGAVSISFALSLILVIVGSMRLHKSSFINRLALTTTQESSEGYQVNFHQESLVGKIGAAYTVLRPSGKVEIDGKIHDAFTRGDFIDAGTAIKVISQESNTLKVKKA